MSHSDATGSVQLANQQSASTVLHRVLHGAIEAFPEAFAAADLPGSPSHFRKTYPDALARFEAARVASGQRSAIARCLAAASRRHLVWQQGEHSQPLAELLAEPVAALATDSRDLPGTPGWQPSASYLGRAWTSAELPALADHLAQHNIITPMASTALHWLANNLLHSGGINLAGRRIVMLGAGAEMAPTRAWLLAGADVLWLDVAPPPAEWLADPALAGRLTWPKDNVDLLTRPQEVLATILAFADGQAVDLGLYAYAPGQAREYRLGGVMGALVDALPPALVASVTLLVSPSSPVALEPASKAAAASRREQRPGWEAALETLGLLGRGGGQMHQAEAAVSRSVVGIQGLSYQAAQYLEKMMAAETWASHGPAAAAEPRPLLVSANVAAITRTRSLQHPVFNAAFVGAGAFGVKTFTAAQSRHLNGLLALRDWFDPAAAGNPGAQFSSAEERAAALGAVRVHGGIHTLPYPLASALQVAAVFGFIRSPGLIRKFWQ